jgi:hypothetical protein
MRENGDIPPSPGLLIMGWVAQETQGGTPEMYECGKSDHPACCSAASGLWSTFEG